MPAALALAAVAAGAATLLLRPHGDPIEPAAVSPTQYFSTEEIGRAEAFRDPQRALGIGGLVVSTGALGLVALRPPRRLSRALERAGRRPVIGAAVVGAAGSVALGLLALPIDFVAYRRALAVGLSTQDVGSWLEDVGKAAAIGAALAALGSTLAVALIRRFPRHWWAPAAATVVVLGALFVYLGPVVLDPVFNRFTPLPPSALRTDVLDLARRSGVEVGQVYVIDASRRTTATNAYVGGLGRTKRVVLYDNLVEGYTPDQVRSVVAHELGHQRHHDLIRGLLWLALVAPPGMFLVKRLTDALPSRGGAGTPAVLPALALAVALVSLAGGVASNALSRRVEASADSFALDLTRQPRPFIEVERRLALSNLSDPDPPVLVQALFGTHPTTMERIGYAVAWGSRPGS